eukprot:1388327-Pyramimonas_sp.AAC.1
MHGPWTPISKLFERGAANGGGQGWTEEARKEATVPLGRLPILLLRVDCRDNASGRFGLIHLQERPPYPECS